MKFNSKKTALLLIDVQNDYWEFPQTPEPKLLSNLTQILNFCRNKGFLIIHVQHISLKKGKYFQSQTKGVEIKAEVSPLVDEISIFKHTPGCFFETSLEETLKKHEIEDIIITGLQTHHCCDTTCREASAHGYNVTIIGDAVGTFDIEGIDNKTIPRELLQYVTLSILAEGFATCINTSELINS